MAIEAIEIAIDEAAHREQVARGQDLRAEARVEALPGLGVEPQNRQLVLIPARGPRRRRRLPPAGFEEIDDVAGQFGDLKPKLQLPIRGQAIELTFEDPL